MTRSTDIEKAERLNAAHALLERGLALSEAAENLVGKFGLSRRQAYRYLEEAAAIGHAVPIGEAAVAITLKVPGSVIATLRAYAAASGLTQGEIVSRALAAFLGKERGRGHG